MCVRVEAMRGKLSSDSLQALVCMLMWELIGTFSGALTCLT